MCMFRVRRFWFLVLLSHSFFLPFVLRSVPAPEEIGSVGDRVSAGSSSGGADCGSGLRHSHRQRACRWILLRHHREWRSSPQMLCDCVCFVFFLSAPSFLWTLMFLLVSPTLISLCLQLSFGAFLGIVGIYLVENRKPMVSLFLWPSCHCCNTFKITIKKMISFIPSNWHLYGLHLDPLTT